MGSGKLLHLRDIVFEKVALRGCSTVGVWKMASGRLSNKKDAILKMKFYFGFL